MKYFFIITILLGIGLVVLAQETASPSPESQATPSPEITETVNLDEDIQSEDLGVSEPKILPDSPFYFLKNWVRNIRIFFAFTPLAKIELKEKFANEKLMELKKLIQGNGTPEAIKSAIENYQNEIEKIKELTEKIKEKVQDDPKIEKFLEKFVNHQILHQNILEKLKNQVPTEVFEKIKEAREDHLEKFEEVMTNLENRKEKLEELKEKVLEKIDCLKSGGYCAGKCEEGDRVVYLKGCISGQVCCKSKEPVACAQVITYCINPDTGECTAYPDACSTPKPCQSCSLEEPPLSPGIDCNNLWWYDNEHRYCQQKEFCGMYMYFGLYTFETKEECETALNQ